MRAIAAFVSLSLPILAFGAEPCTRDEAMAAERVLPSVDSWTAIHRTVKEFGHCDDGATAEGFSEAVARLFIASGHRLGELDQLAKRDPVFRAFVLRHVDATLTPRQLADIEREVQAACPAGADALCKDVSSSAMRARQEQTR